MVIADNVSMRGIMENAYEGECVTLAIGHNHRVNAFSIIFPI